MHKLISIARKALSTFVRKHIVDSEENLWPNMSAQELHELDRAA